MVDEGEILNVVAEVEKKKMIGENGVAKKNGPNLLEMIITICRVKRCIRRYLKTKKKQQHHLKKLINKKYLELAEETQALRSESSRANDPIYP